MAETEAPNEVSTTPRPTTIQPNSSNAEPSAARYDPTGEHEPRPSLFSKLSGATVAGSKAGGKVLSLALRVMWYLLLVWYSLPVLVNLRSLWKYPSTGKLKIRTQTEFAYLYPVISSGPVFTVFIKWFGASPVVLGYIWILLLVYAIYTAIENITWGGAKVMFFAAVAIVLSVAVLGMHFHVPLFSHTWNALKSLGVEFSPHLCNGVSVALGIPFFVMFVSRLFTEQVVFERNSMTVYRIGESKATHTRNAYSCLEKVDDLNETVFGYKTLHMKARSRLDPDYLFRNVPGLAFIGPTLRQLTTATDVEVIADEGDEDIDDGDHSDSDI